MEYIPLGASGLTVSRLGLGGNNFGRRLDLDESRAVVDAALESGINFIDTAEAYGTQPGDSELVLGQVLAKRRDQVVLATKFGNPRSRVDQGHPARHAPASATSLRRSLEASLRRLDTDYIDLYQIHRFDQQTPLEETIGTLADLMREGKVRAVGHSCFRAAQVAEAQRIAHAYGIRFISAQYQWNLLERWVEQDMAHTAIHYGISILPYFPLAQGLLTGKIRSRDRIPKEARLSTTPEWVTDERLALTQRLQAWADEQGRSLLEIALGMLQSHPAAGPIISGASNPAQVHQNVAASHWRPSPAQRGELDTLAPPPSWIS